MNHKILAPDCHNNMALFSDTGCRIGSGEDRPYSGVTTVLDFWAYAHDVKNNMIGGFTAILTLTKPELRQNLTGPNPTAKAMVHDEQLHCLPLYLPCATVGIEVLQKFKKKVVVGAKTKSLKVKSNKVKAGSQQNSIKEKWIITELSQPQSPAKQESVKGSESDCKEVIESPETGGVAFSLPHGSMLLEVAKHELHATTAL